MQGTAGGRVGVFAAEFLAKPGAGRGEVWHTKVEAFIYFLTCETLRILATD